MVLAPLRSLRIWREQRLARRWCVSYDEGDGTTMVAFPDMAALSTFLNEKLGLLLDDDHDHEPTRDARFPVIGVHPFELLPGR